MPDREQPLPHALTLHSLRRYTAVGLVAECCGQHARDARGKRYPERRHVVVWVKWSSFASYARREQLKEYARGQLRRWLWDGWTGEVVDAPNSEAPRLDR